MADFEDRATCVLFGDGAGCVVLEKGDDYLASKITAKGNKEVLNMPNVEGNSPYNQTRQQPIYLYMKGQEVFKFAVTSMYRNLTEVIKKAGFATKDVSWVFPHQANIRILQTAKAKLDIP
ncbi:MAG: 3-oxoacyl-[acyl-carrier-protein] synthase III C-terminal domain-containing protein, partial [Oscillospiraceae bacterium]